MIQRVCPQCGQSFAGQMLCPICGIQLLAPGVAYKPTDVAPQVRVDVKQGHPPFAMRVLIGLIIAQGLYYAFRHFAIAYFEWVGDPRGWWADENRIIVIKVLQAASLLLGGFIAGAALPKAVLAGLLIGLLNSVILMAVETWKNVAPDGLIFWSQPAIHAFMGMVGAVLGRAIWSPLPVLPNFQSQTIATPAMNVQVVTERHPIQWARILIAVVLAFTATVWVEHIRDYLVRFGAGKGGGYYQGNFINWELSGLLVLAASAFAGATTQRGSRHGLIVGILTCFALFGALFYNNIANFPSHQFWVEQLNFPVEGSPPIRRLVLCVILTISTTAAGGWLGGQLFPAIVKPK